jgi:PPK2 family polyphosphate:nucleotide phosphotransferase
MDYRKKFLAKPGERVKLREVDPGYQGKHLSKKDAQPAIQKYCEKVKKLQHVLYSERKHSLLIVLQALDAAGKDGTIDHVLSAMNPQGATVTAFKKPTIEDSARDFLWRVHPHVPALGNVAIFNRSYYEDVLAVRVHSLAPKEVWSERFELINDFERLLRRQNNTTIIKFFLHISPEEQLERFRARLDDPARNWKISENDYKEREYWDAYMEAYEDMFAKTSKKNAPWYVIPANHKWFRNLAVSQIVSATMEDMGMEMPKPVVDLEMIRKQYHQAEKESKGRHKHKKQK